MHTTLKFAAALSVLAAVTLPAFAQEEATENVTVFAPYVVKKTTSGMSKDRVTTVKVSRDVSYQDLDLTTTDGKAQLETRVKDAAADVCKELDRRFPTSVYVPVGSNKDCVKNAIAEVMAEVKGVEQAAKG